MFKSTSEIFKNIFRATNLLFGTVFNKHNPNAQESQSNGWSQKDEKNQPEDMEDKKNNHDKQKPSSIFSPREWFKMVSDLFRSK